MRGRDLEHVELAPGAGAAEASGFPTPPRRPRWRRWLPGCAVAALAVVLGLVAFLGWLVATEPGNRWLVARVGLLVPGSFSVETIQGPLRGPFSVEGVLWEHQETRVEIDRIEIEWRLGRLARRQLDFHRLRAQGIRVVLAPGDDEPEPFELVDLNLRFNVLVRSLLLEDLEVVTGPDAEPVVVERLELEMADLGPKLAVSRIEVVSPHVDLDLAGTLEPVGDYGVDLAVGWALRLPDGPQLAGRGRLEGSLRRLEVAQELSSPFPARVDAILHDPLYDLRFEAEASFSELDPRALAAEAPELVAAGSISGRGTLESFSARGQVAVTSAELGAADGSFAMTRVGDRWQVEGFELTRPDSTTLIEARGEVVTAPLGFAITASWRDLAWPLEGEPMGASGEGGLELEGTLESYRVTLDARLGAAAAGLSPGRWRLEAEGTSHGLVARSLRGETPEGTLRGRAEVTWEPKVRWSFQGEAHGIDPARLELPVPAELGAGSRWRLAARGTDQGAAVELLEGELLGGSVAVSGDVTWEPALAWDGEVRLSGINPGSAWPGWDGRLDLVAKSAATMGPDGLVGQATLEALEGTLRQRPVAAQGALELAGERITLTSLEAGWGDARWQGSGELGALLDVAFELSAFDLGAVDEGAAGELSLEATLVGKRESPRLRGRLGGQELRWGDLAMGELGGEVDVDLAEGGAFELALAAREFVSPAQQLDELALGLEGTQAHHRLTFSAHGPELATTLTAHGAWEEDLWRGEVSTLDFETVVAGTWRLEEPVALLAGPDRVEMPSSCWASEPARLCAAVAWQSDGALAARADLERLSLSLLDPWLPPDSRLEGELRASLRAEAPAGESLVASLTVLPSPGARLASSHEGIGELVVAGGGLEAHLDTQGARARLDLELTGDGVVAGEILLPGWAPGAALEQQPMAGRLTAALGDLAFLESLMEGVTEVGGRLEGAVELSGTVAEPSAAGALHLVDGRLHLAVLGLDLEEIGVTLEGNGAAPLALRGSVRSGQGTVHLAGEVPLPPSEAQPLRVTARGQGVTVAATRELSAVASPDLRVTHTGQRLEIDGEVTVPSATLEVSRPAAEAIQPSRWEVFADQPPEDRLPPGLDLHARVRVVLGDGVRVSGFGLDTGVRGSLLVVDQPDRPTRASGELQLVGGTFQAYGQDLTIEEGRFLFAGGPVANPGLRLRAYRRARDGVRAGVEARGTLEAPEVTLWSEPPMAQGDALAYLLLGRPLEATSEGETDYLAQAATALGLRGGALLAERLGERWGFEEAGIETGDTLEEASLVLGRYLSPRLYVGYGLGLFDPVSTFRLRYRLSDQWTLQGQSGVATSGDLLYTIESGGKR